MDYMFLDIVGWEVILETMSLQRLHWNQLVYSFKWYIQNNIGYEFVYDSTANIIGVPCTWSKLYLLLAHTYKASLYYTKAYGGKVIVILFYGDQYD